MKVCRVSLTIQLKTMSYFYLQVRRTVDHIREIGAVCSKSNLVEHECKFSKIDLQTLHWRQKIFTLFPPSYMSPPPSLIRSGFLEPSYLYEFQPGIPPVVFVPLRVLTRGFIPPSAFTDWTSCSGDDTNVCRYENTRKFFQKYSVDHAPLHSALSCSPTIIEGWCITYERNSFDPVAADVCTTCWLLASKFNNLSLSKIEVPNLGYMYPWGYICLSEGVHLRLATEVKYIFTYLLFPNIYTFIHVSVNSILKSRYMPIVKYTCE